MMVVYERAYTSGMPGLQEQALFFDEEQEEAAGAVRIKKILPPMQKTCCP